MGLALATTTRMSQEIGQKDQILPETVKNVCYARHAQKLAPYYDKAVYQGIASNILSLT